mmetsp:Transcript_7275/g.13811  ORF Transcript_7275/g.13811 Transcript_7275/m.13811 type:complete len:95 (-) Transcript_7275:770-1054(-)
MKNQVSDDISASNRYQPKMIIGILFSDPTIANVVGLVVDTQFRLAKLRKKPTNPAKISFQQKSNEWNAFVFMNSRISPLRSVTGKRKSIQRILL